MGLFFWYTYPKRGGVIKSIDISKFEKEIAAEYLKQFGNEIDPNDRITMDVINVASTAAAIAIKLYDETKDK